MLILCILKLLRAQLLLNFKKTGTFHFYSIWEWICSNLFASTHGDHTVKIIDFATGRVIRVFLISNAFETIDALWSSSHSLDCQIPSSQSRSHCQRLYWFFCHCLELEEKRETRRNNHHAKCDDYVSRLASNVLFLLKISIIEMNQSWLLAGQLSISGTTKYFSLLSISPCRKMYYTIYFLRAEENIPLLSFSAMAEISLLVLFMLVFYSSPRKHSLARKCAHLYNQSISSRQRCMFFEVYFLSIEIHQRNRSVWL